MSTAGTLLLLATAHVCAAMSPGPNTVFVLQAGAKSRSLGLAAALGFWPAGALWSAASLAGLGQVMVAAPWLTTALRVVCGAYLIHLGVRMTRASATQRRAAPLPRPPSTSVAGSFLKGFATNATNPKSIAYMSIFAAVGAFDLPWQARVVAVLLLPTIGFCWYAILVLAVSSVPVRGALRDMSAWLDWIAGCVMVAFGARLIAVR